MHNKIIYWLKIFTLSYAFLFFASCYSNSKEESVPIEIYDHTTPNLLPALETISVFTKSKKEFVITEDETSASISDISVIGNGFDGFNDPIILGETDPLENQFIADLDNDGFDELYLITRSVGSGSYAELFGIASLNDKSYTAIKIVQPDSKDAIMQGYRGHDTYTVTDNVLQRKFPVYDTDATNSEPGNTQALIEYKLHKEGSIVTLTVKNK